LLVVIGIVVLINLKQRQEIKIKSDHSILTNVQPTVKIDIDPIVKLNRPLNVRWQITNSGEKPIYIYSTPLKDTASADIQIDTEQKLIQIRWLRLQPIPVGIYTFPEAEFMQLAAKEFRGGVFISHTSLDSLIKNKISGNVMNKGAAIEGVWRFQLLIAYGYEIESVKKAIEESDRKGDEHPINPVVRWQQVAYSEPIEVNLSSLRRRVGRKSLNFQAEARRVFAQNRRRKKARRIILDFRIQRNGKPRVIFEERPKADRLDVHCLEFRNRTSNARFPGIVCHHNQRHCVRVTTKEPRQILQITRGGMGDFARIATLIFRGQSQSIAPGGGRHKAKQAFCANAGFRAWMIVRFIHRNIQS
jgi:hypothetical protein